MKKLCFIEMEGILAPYLHYVPNKARVQAFLEKFMGFCKKNHVEVFLISGHHETIAQKKHDAHAFGKFFDKNHFLSVDEEYINQKGEEDKKLHRDNLAKDPEFNDTYFKQVAISRILKEKDLHPKDALLLSDDVWVDGYYTNRFSKIDFAIFEENCTDRGKPTQRITGLAYFSHDPKSVELLLTNFPVTDLAALDKYVFEIMKQALVGENVASSIKQGLLKKMQES